MSARRNTLLGGFLLLSLALLTAVTLVLRDWSFRSRTAWTVYFGEDSLVEEGNEVWAAGMKVGTVARVEPVGDAEFTPERQVVATIEIDEAITVWRDGELVLRPRGLLGGMRAELRRGTPAAGVLPPTEPLPGRVYGGVTDQLSDMVSENRGSLRAIMENLRAVTEAISRGEGTAGALVRDRRLYREITRAATGVAEFMELIRGEQTPFGRLLRDDAFRKDLTGIARNVNGILATINTGRGSLGMLLNDDVYAVQLREALTRLARLASSIEGGEGTLGLLLKDPETRGNVKQTLKAVRDFTSALAGSKGTIGKLLYDSRLHDNLLDVSEAAKEVAEDVNAGRGSLGKLLKNDGVYNELQRMLESFRESGDIARENIVLGSLTSFTSLFFNVLN